mmetsp:Transcript_35174/g.100222  ORF Transcript_35174/g.100222 Transcript_35174/m.100222 type:complete len:249 (+) Transcript_35174:389-1135(+)
MRPCWSDMACFVLTSSSMPRRSSKSSGRTSRRLFTQLSMWPSGSKQNITRDSSAVLLCGLSSPAAINALTIRRMAYRPMPTVKAICLSSAKSKVGHAPRKIASLLSKKSSTSLAVKRWSLSPSRSASQKAVNIEANCWIEVCRCRASIVSFNFCSLMPKSFWIFAIFSATPPSFLIWCCRISFFFAKRSFCVVIAVTSLAKPSWAYAATALTTAAKQSNAEAKKPKPSRDIKQINAKTTPQTAMSPKT